MYFRNFFFIVDKSIPLTFCDVIPAHLSLQWGSQEFFFFFNLRNFYPEHFLKAPSCIICSAFGLLGGYVESTNYKFGVSSERSQPLPHQNSVEFQQDSKDSRPQVIEACVSQRAVT